MLRDPDRLKRILLDPERPVQLVIAGKAHPADDGGKRLIQEIVRFADDPEVRHRIVFLPNYDIGMAQPLYPGLRRVAEQPAAPLRGLRHLRHEGRPQRWPQPVDPRRLVGRVVRRQQRLGDPVRRRRRGRRPSRRPRGRPRSTTSSRTTSRRGSTTSTTTACRGAGSRWCGTRSSRSVPRCWPTGWWATTSTSSTPRPPRRRAPSTTATRAPRSSPRGSARASGWSGVRVDHVDSSGVGDIPEVGATMSVHAFVSLGDLAPEDVDVQAVHGRVARGGRPRRRAHDVAQARRVLRVQPAPLRR